MKLAQVIFGRTDYKITSPFGSRESPLTGKNEYHDGCDYGTNAEKWPQYAIEDGEVLSCGKDTNYANAIFAWVSYPRLGIRLLHYHLDQVCVTKGQKVTAGTLIGYTGMTGLATGIHLHLGMKYLNSSAYVDPESFDYVPVIDIKTTERDLSKDQVNITYSMLNARDGANGNKLGVFVPLGIYDVLDTQKVGSDIWIKINEGVWCCLVSECYELLPKKENKDYRAFLEDLYKKIGEYLNG